MKDHTIPHVSFVELAATGDRGDRQHWRIQKGSHKFIDSRPINRKGTGGNAPCNIPNPTVVDLVQCNGNGPEEMTKLAWSHQVTSIVICAAEEKVYWARWLV